MSSCLRNEVDLSRGFKMVQGDGQLDIEKLRDALQPRPISTFIDHGSSYGTHEEPQLAKLHPTNHIHQTTAPPARRARSERPELSPFPTFFTHHPSPIPTFQNSRIYPIHPSGTGGKKTTFTLFHFDFWTLIGGVLSAALPAGIAAQTSRALDTDRFPFEPFRVCLWGARAKKRAAQALRVRTTSSI